VNLGELLEDQNLEQSLAERGLKGEAAKAALFNRSAAALRQRGVPAGEEVQALFVPGRIEVLGKHTDYGGGRSLVVAMAQGFCLVARPRQDRGVEVHAVELGERAAFSLDPELVPRQGHWSNYPMTVARRLARNFGGHLRGAEMAFCSDLPPAAGMSSSSGLMVATYLGLAGHNRLEEQALYRRNIRDALELAAYLGTVENGQSFGELEGDRGVGTFGGSEDHTAMLCSRAGFAGQFSYCPARLERYIAMPQGHVFAVGFSGVVAEKTGAAQELYNRAALKLGAVVQAWRKATGRNEVCLANVLASSPQAETQLCAVLAQVKEGPFSAGELLRRLEHFLAENQEIAAPAGDALERGDLGEFGRLVDRSQELAEQLLENQVPQTMALARLARQEGARAASAFGAGFGGSAWALVQEAEGEEFVRAWQRQYAQAFPQEAGRAGFFLTQAGPAAFVLE
jgi:galactokinase